MQNKNHVMPAQAGIHTAPKEEVNAELSWTGCMDSRFRGSDATFLFSLGSQTMIWV